MILVITVEEHDDDDDDEDEDEEEDEEEKDIKARREENCTFSVLFRFCLQFISFRAMQLQWSSRRK